MFRRSYIDTQQCIKHTGKGELLMSKINVLQQRVKLVWWKCKYLYTNYQNALRIFKKKLKTFGNFNSCKERT